MNDTINLHLFRHKFEKVKFKFEYHKFKFEYHRRKLESSKFIFE